MSPDESTSRRFCSKLILTKLALRCHPATTSAMRHMRIQSHVHSQPEPRGLLLSGATDCQSHQVGFKTNWDLGGTFMPYDGLFYPYQVSATNVL